MVSIRTNAMWQSDMARENAVQVPEIAVPAISARLRNAAQLEGLFSGVLRRRHAAEACESPSTTDQKEDGSSRREMTLRLATRAVVDVSRAALTMPFRSYLFSSKYGSLEKNIGYAVSTNFIINAWFDATGIEQVEADIRLTSILKDYLAYILTVDRFLDDPENKDRLMGFSKDKEVRELRKRFFASIRALDEEKQGKIRALFSADTGAMMNSIMEHRKVRSLSDAEELRKGTSGLVVRSLVRLVSTIYSAPEERAKVVEDAYVDIFGMVSQVHDDLEDLGEDRVRGIGENLIYQILRQNPDELERVRKLLDEGKRMNYNRLAKYAPVTAMEAKKLQDKYIKRIPPSNVFDQLDLIIYALELR